MGRYIKHTPTDIGKNGVLYVNAESDNESNNTLRVALYNREVIKYLDNESNTLKLAEAVQSNYVDINSDDTMESMDTSIFCPIHYSVTQNLTAPYNVMSLW